MLLRIFLFFQFLLFNIHFLFGQTEFAGNKLEFKWDNDFWVQRDRYYSNGLYLAYTTPSLAPIKTTKPFLHTSRIALNHQIFTPTLYNQENINFDRPFVSTLTVDYQLSSSLPSKGLWIINRIQGGIQGRHSGGKTVQNGIHQILPTSDVVVDWIYQLDTDFLINYTVRTEKSLIQSESILVLALAEISLGTPRTYLSPGVHFRVGNLSNYFTEHDESNRESWKYYLFVEAYYQLKFLDTTLRGGSNSKEHPFIVLKINHHLGYCSSGFKISKGGYSLGTSINYLTQEIKDGTSHLWGSVSLSYLLK